MNMHEFYFKKSSRKKNNYNSHLPIIRVPSSSVLSQMTIYTNQWGTCSPSIYIQFIKTSVALYTIKTTIQVILMDLMLSLSPSSLEAMAALHGKLLNNRIADGKKDC